MNMVYTIKIWYILMFCSLFHFQAILMDQDQRVVEVEGTTTKIMLENIMHQVGTRGSQMH